MLAGVWKHARGNCHFKRLAGPCAPVLSSALFLVVTAGSAFFQGQWAIFVLEEYLGLRETSDKSRGERLVIIYIELWSAEIRGICLNSRRFV